MLSLMWTWYIYLIVFIIVNASVESWNYVNLFYVAKYARNHTNNRNMNAYKIKHVLS